MEFKIGSLMNLISGKSSTESPTDQVPQPKIVYKSVGKKRKHDNNKAQSKERKKPALESPDFIPLESSKPFKFSRDKHNKSFSKLGGNKHNKPEIPGTSSGVIGKSFKYISPQVGKNAQNDAIDGDLNKRQYPEDEEKLKRTIFVGNLPLTHIGANNISKLFAPFGEIESFRLRSIPIKDVRVSKKVAAIKKDFHPDRSSTNAYVVLKKPEAAEAALTLNGTIVDGHHLRVDRAEPSGNNDPRKAIFLGNVSFKAEDDDLWKLFEECGEIESVHVLRDKHTNVSKGAAYVNFKSADSVELALRMTGLEIQGRALVIHRCLPGRKKNVAEKSSRQPGPRNTDGPVDEKVRSKEEKRFRKKMIRREKRERENAKNEALGLRSRPLREQATDQSNLSAEKAFCGAKSEGRQKKKKKRINKAEIQRKKIAKILGNVKKDSHNPSKQSSVVNMDAEHTSKPANTVVSETAITAASSDQPSISKKKKKNLVVRTGGTKQKEKKISLEQKEQGKKKKLKKRKAAVLTS